MYFWRIEELKTEMAARPLTEREVLSHLVVCASLLAAVGYIPQAITNVWDGLGAVWSVALAALGTIYIYRQNGGADGQHFLQRYFAIGWVVTLRWFLILVLVAVACFTLLAVLGSEQEETTWYEFLALATIEVVVYWRIGFHVRDLAQRTRAV